MSTQAEVRNRAASMLGRRRNGQAINDALNTRLKDAYDEVYQDLKDDQLVTWAQAGTIPDKITPYFAALMAENCVIDIPVSDSRYKRIAIKASTAKRNIRRLVTAKYVDLDDARDF